MSALITIAEVISTAFDRTIETTKFKDADIEAIQLKHLEPVLGPDFYDAVVATPGDYSTIIAKIKLALAYLVKYYALPSLGSELGTTGFGVFAGPNKQAPNSRDILADHQEEALRMASFHMNTLRKYLYDNTSSYPLYSIMADPENAIIEAGGIAFERYSRLENEDPFYDVEDDYWARRKYYH